MPNKEKFEHPDFPRIDLGQFQTDGEALNMIYATIDSMINNSNLINVPRFGTHGYPDVDVTKKIIPSGNNDFIITNPDELAPEGIYYESLEKFCEEHFIYPKRALKALVKIAKGERKKTYKGWSARYVTKEESIWWANRKKLPVDPSVLTQNAINLIPEENRIKEDEQ